MIFILVIFKKQGRIYLMAEAISQFYRALAPIQPWLVYLDKSYSGPEKVSRHNYGSKLYSLFY